MQNRLLSLDVFRGMTIFFMIVVNTPGSWEYVYSPLLHAKWDGCTPTDLVFPFFLFIVGISMAISYKKFENQPRSCWIQKSVKRGLIIILIGLLLNWFPFYTKNIQDLRLFGVLQRIGLAFLFGALLISVVKKNLLWFLLSGILLLYWLILMTIGDGNLSLEGNLVRIIDLNLFSESHIYKGYGLPFDPEGLLSTLPSIGTVILGYIVGLSLIKKTEINSKIKYLFYLGIACSLVGLLWNYVGFPINKPIWSSSYVLFTGGLGMLLLSCMMWIIDVKKIQNWTYVFNAFGRNPLVTFILSGLFVKISSLIKIGDQSLMSYIYTSVFQPICGDYLGSFLFALSYALFIWLFALILDRKGIIVKV
jgi:predicted acyltransferase